MPELLYEIGTEQLPASYIEPALEQMRSELKRLLAENRLPPGATRTAGTPRRLTVAAADVPERQAPLVEETVGPPAKVAFQEDGTPTKAAVGFARSQDIAVEELRIKDTQKGPYVVAAKEKEGATALEILPDILLELTRSISFPKSMHWVADGIEFARPVRWLVALFGDQVLPLTLNGVQTGRRTFGHAFLSPGALELKDASFRSYDQLLRCGFVIAQPEERRELIRKQINDVLPPGSAALADEALLHEVANLVEYPSALQGSFDEEFLSLPAPILTAAVKEHQRYFPVCGADGRLLARFIAVSDRDAAHSGTIREGNERVLRARLEDARFFWSEDRKTPLEERVPMLKDVVFLGGLGNNLQRTERLTGLCTQMARKMALPAQQVEACARAAHLCKADLLTGLVGELPSLQGIVGRELALDQGEAPQVANAIAEHYRPAGADDSLPDSMPGTVLALADRLDVILGCFTLGLLPSGSKDPYALRRNAQAILLILEGKELKLSLRELLALAREQYETGGITCDDEVPAAIEKFFGDRLYNMAIERGVRHDFVRAVLAAGFEDVRNFWVRLRALVQCAEREWWPALVELVDRTFRIQRDVQELPPLREDMLQEPLEIEVARILIAERDGIVRAFEDERYLEAAELYSSRLAQKVHEFFEEVFVNVEDHKLRLNRKSLCAEIYRLFASHFADLYLIETVA